MAKKTQTIKEHTKIESGKDDKAKEFELNFFERMQLRNLYPVTKTYSEIVLRDKLLEKLVDEKEWKERKVMSELECKACGYLVVSNETQNCPRCQSSMQSTNRLRWVAKDEKGKQLPDEKKVTLGEMSWHTIQKTLKELNEAEALEPIYRTLYEKFVLDGHVETE